MSKISQVTLPDLPLGQLLREVMRAQMTRACPSGVLHYLKEGIKLYTEGPGSDDDKKMAQELLKDFEELYNKWRQKEDLVRRPEEILKNPFA